MEKDKAIICKHITKKYKLYESTKERLLDLITPKEYGEEFYALANVNFEAEKGDVVGFVGINGSGKSTLSNIIAGIVPETSGSVIVNGETALIAVAAGLRGDLTGRDNIELKCLMLGFSKEEIKEMEPEIIEFSELGKFIDQPVKSYSSGMKSRLGFAISVTVDPDILIIDEALSVGDKAFAEKSLNKMKEFKKQGKTMIFVSHSIGQMKQFCDKILWLEFGMVKDFGLVNEVIPKYERFLNHWKKMGKQERNNYRTAVLEHQREILIDNKEDIKAPDIERYVKSTQKNKYTETPTSLLGHIQAGESYIYEAPTSTKILDSTKTYKNYVYYIKKQANFNGERFYLISNRPSAVDGVIGWMKASDMSIRSHIAIDKDPKTFYFKGKGCAYNLPWGGKKNLVYSKLSPYKGEPFQILQTDKVGRNFWYFGILDGKEVWIHYSHLTDTSS